jgi:hypothetical protein
MKMKLRTQTPTLFMLALLGLFLANCGGGGNETPKAKIELKKLSKEWTLTSAMLDNDEKIDDLVSEGGFDNMTLTIDGTYSSSANALYDYTVGGTMPTPSPWPKPGQTENKWKFVSADGGLITRDPSDVDDAVAMTYAIVDGELIIEFNIPNGSAGWPGGKAAQVSGNWRFVFE